MQLGCKSGLMYLKFHGIPTDKDLQTYPSVHLTTPQEWDSSVLDYVHPKDNGEPNSTMIQLKSFKLIQHLMNLMIISTNYFQLHPKLHQPITYWLINIQQWGVKVDFFPMKRHLKSWNSEGRFSHDPGGRIICP